MFTRRTFVASAAAATALVQPRATYAETQVSAGNVTLTTLSDGHLTLPAAFFFDGLPQDELTEILVAHSVPRDQLTPPCNVTLLQTGAYNVLFDVGAGPAFMPTAGALGDSLDAIGVTPDDITHVMFTHAHPDHLWGLLDDFDDPVFTQAQYLIGQTEWDYWTDPNTVSTIGEARASFAVGAARRLEAIRDQVRFVQDGQSPLPGVAALASFGHTPGHMAYEIDLGTSTALVAGDAIGNDHVSFARPEWPSGADQDGETGAATRARLLDKLASDDTIVIGFHLPGGGIGRVDRRGDGYHFVPEAT